MIRVIMFEDNKNYREALTDAFSLSDQVFMAKTFDNAQRAAQRIREYQPDVVLMDIEMPVVSGLDALNDIRKHCPDTKVMMLTEFEDHHRIFVALCRGAWGYAIKSDSFDKLFAGVIQVHEGGGYFSPAIAGKITRLFQNESFSQAPDYVALTERELEILTLLGKALKYQQIADTLFLSYEGVHSHIKNIYRKLHVSSKSEAILKAIAAKLI